MTSLEPRPRGGRFGAATPGARLSPPSLEPLLTATPMSSPRRRGRLTRGGWLALGLVIVLLGGAYAAGHFTWPKPAPVPPTRLVVTTAAIPAGARLSGADLRVISVAPGVPAPPGALRPAPAAALIGQVAKAPLPAGTFVATSLFGANGSIPGPAQALVGLTLKPGQLPSGGLVVGEQVLVVQLLSNSQNTRLIPIPLTTTTVWDVHASSSAQATLASVVVPVRLATKLSGYADQGDVVLLSTDSHGGGATSKAKPSPSVSTSAPAKAHGHPRGHPAKKH
jgi:SAF domain-containing protein